MDIGQYVIGTTVLIGFVNGVKLAINNNWRGFGFFMTAVISGIIFGYLGWFTIPSVEVGFALGVASSGMYEVGQRVGGIQ